MSRRCGASPRPPSPRVVVYQHGAIARRYVVRSADEQQPVALILSLHVGIVNTRATPAPRPRNARGPDITTPQHGFDGATKDAVAARVFHGRRTEGDLQDYKDGDAHGHHPRARPPLHLLEQRVCSMFVSRGLFATVGSQAPAASGR